MRRQPVSLYSQNLVQLHCRQQGSAKAGLVMLTESVEKIHEEYFSLHLNLLGSCRLVTDQYLNGESWHEVWIYTVQSM